MSEDEDRAEIEKENKAWSMVVLVMAGFAAGCIIAGKHQAAIAIAILVNALCQLWCHDMPNK